MRADALAGLLAVLLLPGPLSAQEGTFTRAEYWECPEENMGELAAAMDSIWGPMFDDMVEEGRFGSWHLQRPVGAVDYEFQGGEATAEEVPSPWQMVGVWTAPDREAMDDAWEEFLDRLQTRFPDDPRPDRFCTDVLIVDYVQRRGR